MIYVLYIVLTANSPPAISPVGMYANAAACMEAADAARRKRKRVITYCAGMTDADEPMLTRGNR